jgi:hypothetical protein
MNWKSFSIMYRIVLPVMMNWKHILHEVTQQLDDDSSDSVLDFKKLLEQDIRKSRRYIRKKKASWLMFGVSICLLIATIAAILIFVMMETNYIL